MLRKFTNLNVIFFNFKKLITYLQFLNIRKEEVTIPLWNGVQCAACRGFNLILETMSPSVTENKKIKKIKAFPLRSGTR